MVGPKILENKVCQKLKLSKKHYDKKHVSKPALGPFLKFQNRNKSMETIIAYQGDLYQLSLAEKC